MILILRELIKRSGGDDFLFFQTAFQWCYGKQIDVWGDILAYRLQGHVPNYVQKYVKHIEQSM